MTDNSGTKASSVTAWVIAYRAILLALAASTTNGVVYAHTHHREFEAAFPGLTHLLFTLMMLAATVGLASLVGLWFWRRWALWAYGLVGVVVIALDLLARGPLLHITAAVVSTIVVLGLSYQLRERFR